MEAIKQRVGYEGKLLEFLKYAHGAYKFFYRNEVGSDALEMTNVFQDIFLVSMRTAAYFFKQTLGPLS